MKRFLSIKLVLFVVIVAVSCTKDFEEYNTNPNYPESVTPNLILTNILYQTAVGVHNQALYIANGLSQYTAQFDFNDSERYDIGSNPTFWTNLYATMRDIDNLTEIANQTGNDGYEAVGLIMRAYIASHLTDLWGDVPYFEALKGKAGGFNPAYDSQEDIYLNPQGILDNLKTANDMLKESSAIIQGDIIFQGNLLKWRKFANSLSLRYLLRISAQEDVSASMQDILDNEPIFESNADNALMNYLSSHPNQFNLHVVREGSFNLIRMSDMTEETLKAYDDPRLSHWFRPTEDSEGTGTPEYKGMPVGLVTQTQSEMGIQLTDISRLSEIFRELPNAVDAILMSYSELQFVLAEAAAKGLISGGLADAKAYYDEGVESSFGYYNLDIPAGYLTHADVEFTSTDDLDRILTQKWIANFMVGYEAWYDYRRTGLPELKPVIDNSNAGQTPSRFYYPSEEQSLNADNYQAAVANQGGSDNINTRVWWEK